MTSRSIFDEKWHAFYAEKKENNFHMYFCQIIYADRYHEMGRVIIAANVLIGVCVAVL